MNTDAGAEAARSGGVSASFELLDANGDGRISQEEFAASPATPARSPGSFDRANESTGGRNGGTVGVDRVPMNDDPQRTASGPGMAGSPQNPAPRVEEFRQADRDGDGYLSRNELTAAKRDATRAAR
jgi:hypothetical protein